MSLRFFLDIPGIPGGSTSARFRDTIELLSYSLGFSSSQTPNLPVSSFGAGFTFKIRADQLAVQKRFDESSIPLFATLARGRLLREMTLYVTRETGDGLRILLKYTFKDVTVNVFNQSAQEEDSIPIETVQFDYSIITMESDIFDQSQSVTYDRRRNIVT